MTSVVDDALRSRVKNLKAMPAMPVSLGPLLRRLELPPDQIEIDKVSELISQDKSIVAQCLRMTNSPLFCRHKAVDSIRAAVVALGAQRLRDVLWSCNLVRLVPKGDWPIDPAAFWQHSFACALVSQQLAKKIEAPEVEKVYLCGLLHDIGEVLNATLLPEEFGAAARKAIAENISLFDAEKAVMGFTHCDTGKLLAEYWALPDDARLVVEFHHTPELAGAGAAVAALVNLADLPCRMREMGYGYYELREVNFQEEPAWSILLRHAPHLGRFDVFRFTMELEAEAEEISRLVATAFGS